MELSVLTDSDSSDQQGGDAGEECHHRPEERIFGQKFEFFFPVNVDSFDEETLPTIQLNIIQH